MPAETLDNGILERDFLLGDITGVPWSPTHGTWPPRAGTPSWPSTLRGMVPVAASRPMTR
ncbi:hypothetical protein GPX89_38680 [Nocardia sp. ET3-3]|uniref:Uncharacterized protein n=1 Tax=Nocardia terrae TaxID=2675851 RepID=A0A7K1V926_9NOCA|nr:hypothetical protein [Nocardia terrae]MVU83153.1 hypothetical protein [Nocardia terrae]